MGKKSPGALERDPQGDVPALGVSFTCTPDVFRERPLRYRCCRATFVSGARSVAYVLARARVFVCLCACGFCISIELHTTYCFAPFPLKTLLDTNAIIPPSPCL